MRERLRRYGGRILVTLLWIAAAYYFLFGGEYTLRELDDLQGERDSLAARVDSLEGVADSLQERAERLREDTLAIERTARERYGFIRDGERLFRFVGTVSDGSTGTAQKARDPGGTRVDRSGRQK